MNDALQAGTLMMRELIPAEVSFRTEVNYMRVSTLEAGMIASAISDLLEGAEPTFSGLDQVARGVDADAAFDAL